MKSPARHLDRSSNGIQCSWRHNGVVQSRPFFADARRYGFNHRILCTDMRTHMRTSYRWFAPSRKWGVSGATYCDVLSVASVRSTGGLIYFSMGFGIGPTCWLQNTEWWLWERLSPWMLSELLLWHLLHLWHLWHLWHMESSGCQTPCSGCERRQWPGVCPKWLPCLWVDWPHGEALSSIGRWSIVSWGHPDWSQSHSPWPSGRLMYSNCTIGISNYEYPVYFICISYV